MSDERTLRRGDMRLLNKAELTRRVEELLASEDQLCARVDELHAQLAAGPADYQHRVGEWMQACFGSEISADRVERNHRFLEEAVELVQANGCTQAEAHQLMDYVFARPTGELDQEIGGVMVTLAALCSASGADMAECGRAELARVWTAIDKIRAKRAAKPKHSPLPEHPNGAQLAAAREEALREVVEWHKTRADEAAAIQDACHGAQCDVPKAREYIHRRAERHFRALIRDGAAEERSIGDERSREQERIGEACGRGGFPLAPPHDEPAYCQEAWRRGWHRGAAEGG